MVITTGGDNYGLIQPEFNFEIPDGYTVLVGKNNSGKSSLLQLIFKRLVEDGSVGPSKVCLLLPERIFIEPTLEVGGDTMDQYNRTIHNQLNPAPLSYYNATHASQKAFKLLITNHRQRMQLDSSDKLLEALGFPNLDINRGQVIIDSVSVGKHGSGLRTVLPIIAALTDPTINFVLIDEPEQSLEPSIQKLVRDMLYEAAESKKIIVTTHSHLFLNRKTIQSNYIVLRNKNTVSITQVKSDIEMYDLVYKLLGSSPDDLFFPKNFLVVEGASDQIVVEKVRELMGYKSFDIKIISASSVSDVDDYRRAFEACLTPYVLKESFYKDKVLVLVDKPNPQTQSTIDEIRRNIGDRLFELPEESLEEYIPEHIYSRAGRVRQNDVLSIKDLSSKGDYNQIKSLKESMSKAIADHLQKKDLSSLKAITDALEKGLQ